MVNASSAESQHHAQNEIQRPPHSEIEQVDNIIHGNQDAFWINPKLTHTASNTDAYRKFIHDTSSPAVTQTSPRCSQYLRLILTARVYDVAIESPFQLARNLSTRVGNQIYLKREDLQPVFSFKLRGAYNRMVQLSAEERAKGVIACSAGNHAQGVALAAQKLGLKATIVMPTLTPPIKWQNVKRLGAEVLLFGADFDEAKKECYRIAGEKGITVIPPYDDPYVIAGQGTVATEIVRQTDPQKIDAIFCCVGGGGLLAGVSSYIKALFPHIKVIGVETFDADAMLRSLQLGRRVELKQVGVFSDGTAVKLVGKETFDICQETVDEMVLVGTDEICAAIKDIFEDTRSIVEPAGALALAGAKKWLSHHGHQGLNVAVITSGANMNFDRLRFVNERAEVGEGREVLMSAIIPETPGSFNKFYSCIHPRSITEFSYRYGDPNYAHIFLSLTVNPLTRSTEISEIQSKLNENGMKAMDISANEMAKSHARYLVGGRKNVPNERLYRFTFPERPFALERFLQHLNSHWNVSLFHYRNNGGDVAKVLVGIQVPSETENQWEEFLKQLMYPFKEETNNEVYLDFLRGGC